MPLVLYFVRHGQAFHDPDTPDPPLSNLGVVQAKKTAKRLAETHFDYAYVSSLRRARQTADEILAPHPNVKRVITDDIQEVSRFHFQHDTSAIPDRMLPGLEAERDVLQRFVNRIRREHRPGSQILLICHGNVIRVLIPMFCNRIPSESVLLEVFNCSVSIIDLFPSGTGILRLANSVEHLAKEEITDVATPWPEVSSRPPNS